MVLYRITLSIYGLLLLLEYVEAARMHTLIFKIGRFLPIILGISASTPRIWFAGMFEKPCERYQQCEANSKVGIKQDKNIIKRT